MRKRWFSLAVCIVFFSAAVIGCSFTFPKKNKPKVVVVVKDLHTQYWEIVKAGAEKGFQDFGIDGKVVAPRYPLRERDDVDAQKHLLEMILKEKPDVLIVSPHESPVIISALKRFVEKKIPVLLLDTDLPLKEKTSYIGTDNFDLGRKAGELLASQLQPGDEVALIAGDLSSVISGERIKGAKFSLEAAGIKIKAEKTELPNEPVPVREAVTTIFQEYSDVKGIFAVTDIMAISALQVIEKYGYNIPVVGADGIIKMVELIAEGTLTATVAQNPYDMGFISAETALRVTKGEKVQTAIDSGVDIITEDNAKEKLTFLKEVLNKK